LIRREPQPNVDVEVLSVDLEAVWERRAGAANLTLVPRDVVYVFHLESGRQQYIQPLIDEIETETAAGEPLPLVRVGGQVRAVGEYPLEPGMRVGDLVRAGGGLNDAAYVNEAELNRYAIVDGEFRETELIPVNLAAALRGDAAANILLAPYDNLNVKQISRWGDRQEVTLTGEFVFPGNYQIRQGERLSSVIERAGGLTDFAFVQGSIFTRENVRETQREQLATLARRMESDLAALALSDPDSDALASGQSLLDRLREAEATGRLVIRLEDVIAGNIDADIILQGGDQLIVPEFSQEVTVLGEVQYEIAHVFAESLSRDDYIDRSGGLTRRADARRVYVVRANGEVLVESGGRWFRRDTGIDIRPGDTIVAPLDVERIRPLTLWSSVTQIVYNLAIAAAAVNSF
jgi:protein involved in polysaccharide export with SLBB domain